MNLMKVRQDKRTITSAILFSLLVHLAMALILISGLSSGASFTPKLNGIKLVWVSFTDKKAIHKVDIGQKIPVQQSVASEKSKEQSFAINVPTTKPEDMPVATIQTASFPGITVPVKNETTAMEFKGKPHGMNSESTNETQSHSSNLNTVIAYPLYKENAPPVYPEIARVRGYEGIVLLSAEVLPNGRVGEIKIRKSSGYAILDQSALQAVKPWKFEPAKRAGNPFTAWVELPIKFILHSNSQS